MANSKFPLNGRYTTLGDLVHEYALSSIWPVNPDSSYGWDINDKQPFIKMVYTYLGNDEYEAKWPYELVWFGNVYSNDVYEPSTRMRKLLQMNDSSVYGFDRYIIASKISDNATIAEKGIQFRYIVPDKVGRQQLDEGDDQFRFTYNYKMDNGEATVLYTLQCIIDTLDNLDKLQSNEQFTEHRSSKLFLCGSTNIQTLGKDDNMIDTSVIQFTYIPQSGGARQITMYPLFNKYIFDDLFEINQIDKKVYVKPDSYTLLGSYYETSKMLWYENYTTLTSDFDIPNTWPFIESPKNYYELKSLIYFVINTAVGNSVNSAYIPPENESKIDEEFSNELTLKSYLRATVGVKLLYYTYWFLHSQRYHVSYITSCQFVKISSVTYLPNQPVLRCDLNLQRVIEKFRIIEAVHVHSTMLPPGPLSESTSITVNISYIAKFRNIAKETESSFELTLTFRQLRQLSDAGEGDFIWYRLYYPGHPQYATVNDSTFNGCTYGMPDPDDYTWTPFPNVTVNDWSLKTAEWPINDSRLKIDINDFERAKTDNNFNNGNCYADTYDINTYKLSSSDEAAQVKEYIKQGIFPPGGMMRIHNCYVRQPEEQAVNSSYYFDVSILRKINFFYEKRWAKSDTGAQNNIIANLYYEPLYQDDSDPFNIPNTVMPLIVKGMDEAQPSRIDGEDGLEQLFLNNLTGDSRYYSFAQLPSSNQEVYLTIKSLAGIMHYYVSGDQKFIADAGSEPEYINDNNTIYVDCFNATGTYGSWYDAPQYDRNALQSHTPITSLPGTDVPIEPQYNLVFNSNVRNSNITGFNYFRIHFADTSNYIYFRMNDYKNIANSEINSISIKYLETLDCINEQTYVPGIGANNEVLLNHTSLCFLTYHEADLKNSNLMYTRLSYGDTRTGIGVKKYNEADPSTNYIYLKTTSVKFEDPTNYHDRFLYTTTASTSLYIAYTTNSIADNPTFTTYMGYKIDNTNNIFTKIQLQNSLLKQSNACTIYLSLTPIYIISVGFTPITNIPEITDMSLDYIHYTVNDVDTSTAFVSETNLYNQMVTSCMSDMYITPNCISFKLNGVTTTLADESLYDNFKVGVELGTNNNGIWSREWWLYNTTTYGHNTGHGEVDISEFSLNLLKGMHNVIQITFIRNE